MKRTLALIAGATWLAAAPTHAVDFAKDIAPIFEKRCLECHGPEKQKGKLRLDRKDDVLSRKDAVLVPGKADDSDLYHLVTLPKGHDDIMPAKGDPLTKEQTDLIKEWINTGAKWPDGYVVGAAPAAAATVPAGAGTSANELRAAATQLREAAARLEAAAAALDGGMPGQPAKREPTPEELAALAKAKEAQAAAIAEIAKSGVSVRPIALNSEWHEANFRVQGTNVTDATLAPLSKVYSLVDLNLAATAVTDAGLAHLKNLTNLTTLHLEKTGVTDAGLANLAGLKQLTYLNLYDTGITDAGLEKLHGLKSLERLYVWQTKATDAGVEKLKKALPSTQVSTGVELAVIKQVEEEQKRLAEEKKKAEEKAKAEAEAKKKAEEEAKKKAEAAAKAEAEKKAEEKK